VVLILLIIKFIAMPLSGSIENPVNDLAKIFGMTEIVTT